MARKASTFIDVELEFAERKLSEWKEYLEAHPINSLQDRIQNKATARGGVMPMVIASIEQQGKFLQETLKNYLSLLGEVDKLREKEEAKKTATRGDIDLSPFESGDI